ncbi:MAG: hypothetical protein K6F00_00745 [Lachnospiraceae bacterium]|nr:hypothetical protein [Lachnospiraceae bacterium]
MILGTDGSRYDRIGKHLHYQTKGKGGMIRFFNGALYDNNKPIGHVVGETICLPDCSVIKKVDDTIFYGQISYKLEDEKMIGPGKVWFGVTNDWDALRIVLKETV